MRGFNTPFFAQINFIMVREKANALTNILVVSILKSDKNWPIDRSVKKYPRPRQKYSNPVKNGENRTALPAAPFWEAQSASRCCCWVWCLWLLFFSLWVCVQSKMFVITLFLLSAFIYVTIMVNLLKTFYAWEAQSASRCCCAALGCSKRIRQNPSLATLLILYFGNTDYPPRIDASGLADFCWIHK